MTRYHVSTANWPTVRDYKGVVIPEAWLQDGAEVIFHPSRPSNDLSASVSVRIDGASLQLGFWTSQDTDGGELEQLRDCFLQPRRKMRHALDQWRSLADAAEDCFSFSRGQRAFYRRRSNEALRRALGHAEEWRLAKAVWRNLTSLRQGR